MASLVQILPRATSSGSNAGSNRNQGPNSVSGLLSTLIPSFLVACFLLGAFLLLRTRLQRIYAPRTYLGVLSDHQKTPKTSPSLFGWIPEFMRLKNEYALSHHSLDAYFFLRFWNTVTLIVGIGWPVTWIILMPIYGTSHAGEQQFDKISFSNIEATQDSNRLYAVAIVAWLLFGAIMYLIGRESLYCVKVKHAFLCAPGIASRLASRTVLFTSVTGDHIPHEKRIREMYSAVRSVWFVTDTKDLDDLIKDSDGAVNKLEGALVKLSKAADAKLRKARKEGKSDTERKDHQAILEEIEKDQRPTHRLKPLIGQKVDTIDWSREQLNKLIPDVQHHQQIHIAGQADYVSAVFVEFETVHAARAAAYNGTPGKKLSNIPRAVGMRPNDVIWSNLGMSELQRKLRTAVVLSVIGAMIIFWGPFTAFVGAVSNINSLTDMVPFLSFINAIPSQILGIVTGLLPTVLLAVLMILVPVIMRFLFKLAGSATLSEVELRTQTWYFVFQVIQVFLITTLASGAAATVTDIIAMPSSATTLLARNLPKASNFYISYFVLYGLAIAAKQLFNIVAVLVYYLLGKFLDKTPRKMYNRYINITGLGWGSLYPKFTNLAVIAISYSCIAPLVLAFATIGFIFLTFAFRYAVFYSTDTMSIDTQGRAYLKALNQLTTGVYLAEVCLVGLMAISVGSSRSAIGPLVIMIVLLVVTAVYHFMLNRSISTLNTSLTHESSSIDDKDIESSARGSKAANGGREAIGKLAFKNAGIFAKIMRLPDAPTMSKDLMTPMPEYSEPEHQEAYLNPSVTSPPPIIWIARDQVGVSQREIAQAKKAGNIQITDEGAWWDEKTGKLTTLWTADTNQQDNKEALRSVPIWDGKVHY